MGLMEPGCKLEGFGRPAQPAVSNRLRCRAIGSVWTIWSVKLQVRAKTGLCMVVIASFKVGANVFEGAESMSNVSEAV